jgi:hypothetical protein
MKKFSSIIIYVDIHILIRFFRVTTSLYWFNYVFIKLQSNHHSKVINWPIETLSEDKILNLIFEPN